MPTPCVNIFWNERENRYLVQNQVAAPEGGSEPFGEAIIVPADAVGSTLPSLVLEGLEKYCSHVYEPKPSDALSVNRLRKFFMSHKLVSVAKGARGEILVSACEHRGVLFSGVAGGQVKLPPNSTKENLTKAILEAFKKAK